MKKAISILLPAVLVFAACFSLCACGKNKGEEKDAHFVTLKEISKEYPAFKSRFKDLDSLRYSDIHYVYLLTEKDEGEITVPDTYKGKKVVLVTAEGATPKLTSLTVEDNVGYIESVCGEKDQGGALEKVRLPKSIIAKNCFNYCGSLKSADISGAMKTTNCFNDSSVEELNADNVKNIINSFNRCAKLKNAGLSNVISVENSFEKCGALESVKLDSAYTVKSSFYKCEQLKTVELSPESEVSGSFQSCTALSKANSPKKVESSFLSCNALTNADFSVAESIEESFDNTGITELDAPNLTTIKLSFRECSDLAKVSLPKVESISDSFNDCGALKEFGGCENLESIENSLNDCPSMTAISQFKSIRSVTSSFCRCDGIQSTNFTKNASNVAESFKECPNMQKVVLDNAEKITESFSDCPALKSASIAFSDSASYATFSNSFNDLPALGSVSVSGTLDEIDSSFNNCAVLKSFNYESLKTDPTASFDNCPKLETEVIDDAERERRAQIEAERRKYDNEPYGPGSSGLYLEAGDGQMACFRLVRMNGSTEFKVLLNAGESTTEYFPSGRYTLKVARGDNWISDEKAFGSSGRYSTTDVFTFEDGSVYEIVSGDRSDFNRDNVDGFLE